MVDLIKHTLMGNKLIVTRCLHLEAKRKMTCREDRFNQLIRIGEIKDGER